MIQAPDSVLEILKNSRPCPKWNEPSEQFEKATEGTGTEIMGATY